MRFSIRMFGLELFTIEASTEADEDDTARDLSGGTTAATPVGFTPSWGDQAWEPGAER